jgi:hypothetical protein
MSPTRNHCELLTASGASDSAETFAHYLQTPLLDFSAWSGWLGRCTIQFFQARGKGVRMWHDVFVEPITLAEKVIRTI